MPDYKESSITGRQWQRCHTVIVRNPLGQTPTMEFEEETVVEFGAEQRKQWSKGCSMDFVAEQTIPLRDPTTNALTGTTVTHAELYQILYSLYMQAAEARDAALP